MQENELNNVVVEIARKLEGFLPIKAAISEVVLIENLNGRWTHRARFPLGD